MKSRFSPPEPKLQERSKSPHSKKRIEKLEKFIMETEELIELPHNELLAASNSGDNSKVMEFSQLVGKEECTVEEKL